MEDGYTPVKMNLRYTPFYVFKGGKIETLFSFLSALIAVLICKSNFLWYAIAFIGFDILGILILTFANICYTMKWEVNTIDAKIEKTKSFIKILDDTYYSNLSEKVYSKSRVALNQLRTMLSELQAEKTEIEEETKEKDLKSNQEIAIYLEELTTFKKKLSVIRTEENKEFLKELTTKLKELINLVSEKPATSVFTNKIFNLYLPELVALMSSIPKDEENRKEFDDNITEVLSEIDNLVDNTKKTILNFNQRNVEISFDVLKKEIKKAGEELED